MTDFNRPAVLWFRNDQRISDNPALFAASKHKSLLPVFIWSPEEEGPWEPGGAASWWLHRSLIDLDRNLKQKNSSLHVCRGNTLDHLEKVIKQTGAAAVYWNRRYEPKIIERDSKIKRSLIDDGIYAESFNSSLLNEPWEVLKKDGTPYQVYTAYWKVAKLKIKKTDTSSRVKMPPLPNNFKTESNIDRLNLNPTITWDDGFKKFWQPGEAHGKKLISNFLKTKIKTYNTSRDLPAISGTSLLSPYLHFGNISPRKVWSLVTNTPHNDDNSQQFLKELIWREFAAQLLYHFPHTDKLPLRDAYRKFPWKNSAAKLASWQQGKTGYPIVDAGMRQLWHIGWMHNRVRMIAASFLVKDLQINWYEGARWFWDTLVDADLASNTMGWQWTAGCGADAAPYFRVFNPMLQGSRFDPEGIYIRRWIPELKNLSNKWIHAPWEAPLEELRKAGIQLGKDYPKPIVDHFEAKERALLAYEKIKIKK